MNRERSITVSCLVLVAGILTFPSTQPLDAAAKTETKAETKAKPKPKPKSKPKTKAQCLENCQSEYTICTNNCDKKKTLQEQSKCVNNCLSAWNCCQDICYGTRKTCP